MAAAKVFAIPELLEHILVDLSDATWPEYNEARDLIVLQRVNRMFADVIATSGQLRRHMRFENIPNESSPPRIPIHISRSMLSGQDLFTKGITFEAAYALESDILVISFHKYHGSEKQFANPNFGFGKRGARTGHIYRGKQESWRKMKTCILDLPVALEVWEYVSGRAFYSTYPPGKFDTIGSLVDELEFIVRGRGDETLAASQSHVGLAEVLQLL